MGFVKVAVVGLLIVVLLAVPPSRRRPWPHSRSPREGVTT